LYITAITATPAGKSCHKLPKSEKLIQMSFEKRQGLSAGTDNTVRTCESFQQYIGSDAPCVAQGVYY
jgi:hypothetical protein